MAFEIKLYQNLSEKNAIQKRIVLWGSVEGTLREETSIVNPEIMIELNQSEISGGDVPDFNYAYIQSFNRYYFVEEIVSVRQDLWRMKLHVDVLMSYRQQILQQEAVIARNEIDFNPWLIDDKIPATNERVVDAPLIFPKEPLIPGASHQGTLVLEAMWSDAVPTE